MGQKTVPWCSYGCSNPQVALGTVAVWGMLLGLGWSNVDEQAHWEAQVPKLCTAWQRVNN